MFIANLEDPSHQESILSFDDLSMKAPKRYRDAILQSGGFFTDENNNMLTFATYTDYQHRVVNITRVWLPASMLFDGWKNNANVETLVEASPDVVNVINHLLS